MAQQSELDELRSELEAARNDLSTCRGDLEEAWQQVRSTAAREQRLQHELEHRVRNMLAVIRSVFRRTAESGDSHEDLLEHFRGRLDVFARHHSLLSRSPLRPTDLENIVRDGLLASAASDSRAYEASGPVVGLRHKSAELLALTVHELATNSIKFGALGRADGKLAIDWSVSGTGGGQALLFRWLETGIPIVAATPLSRGFGRQFIEEALPYELGATTSLNLNAGQLEWIIELPLMDLDDSVA